jgi:hypothetical protein
MPVSHSLGLLVWARPLKHRTPTFGYGFQELPRAGVLDAKKARALGAEGKQLGLIEAPPTPNLSTSEKQRVFAPTSARFQVC